MSASFVSKQHSLFVLLPAASAAGFLSVGVMLLAFAETPAASLFLVGAAAFALTALSFQSMVVRDEGDHLVIGFGPLPFFHTHVRYDDIHKVERLRLPFFGVPPRKVDWRLWRADRVIWSVGGHDCVRIQREADTIQVVLRDAGPLAAFLEHRIAAE